MNQVIHETAPAKLNLALSVGPPRSDGLHPICSWMVTVSLLDELEVRPLLDGSLSRYAIFWHEDARKRTNIDWPIRSDLAVRAHLALQKHVGRELPVQMKIAKRIPIGGGLGGGSSDAAAMLRAVNSLYELDLSNEKLATIGSSIGSDVAFFIAGGSANVSGIGEIVHQHQERRQLHAVIVFPQQLCDTAAVYRQFDEGNSTAEIRAEAIEKCRGSDSMQVLSESLFNDLAEPAQKLEPVLREHIRESSTLAERPAHITGSGSSLFIICDDALHAEALAETLEKQMTLPAVAVTMYEPVHEPIAR